MRRKNAEKRGHFVPEALEGAKNAHVGANRSMQVPACLPRGTRAFRAPPTGMVVEADLRKAMTTWFHAAVARLRSWRTPNGDWIDFHGPWLPLSVLALALPLLLSGPVRALTSLSLPLSLALAVPVCAAIVWLLWPWLRFRLGRRPRLSWTIELLGSATAGLAIWALYVRDFAGFPNLDGWDGGTHVFIKDQFATLAPTLYSAQVSYYAFTWWLQKLLGLDGLRSFAVAFYLTVAVTVLVPLAIAWAVVRSRTGSGAQRAGLIAGLCVSVVGMLGALWLVVLPLLHYNQAAGYYVHVFGLIPLLGLWAADALLRQPVLRVMALLGGFALLRYTYALNLADAAVALAGVLLLEGFRGRWRLVQMLVAAGLVVAAILAVGELRPVFRVWGGMQRFDVDKLLRTDLTVVVTTALFVLASLRDGPGRAWLGSSLVRALRFPLLFALASGFLVSVLRRGQGVQYYYVTKYPMWACMLLALAVVVAMAYLATLLCERGWPRRPTVWLRVLAMAAVLATAAPSWAGIFIGYRTTMLERVRPHGPLYQHLHPVADVEALGRIKRILATEDKRFGGYLTAFFPMFSFMNAELGRHAGYQDFFPPAAQPGHCVFWVSPERDIHRLGPAHKLDALRASVALPGSPCSEYLVPWKPTPHSLCYRCY